MNHSGQYVGFFITHSIFLNYAVFGGMFASSKSALLIHTSVFPITMLHWKTNKEQCFLTEIEQKLVKNTKYEEWVNKSPLFTQRYLSLLGIHMNEPTTEKVIRIIFILSWGYTVFKLFSLIRLESKSPLERLFEQKILLPQKFQSFQRFQPCPLFPSP